MKLCRAVLKARRGKIRLSRFESTWTENVNESQIYEDKKRSRKKKRLQTNPKKHQTEGIKREKENLIQSDIKTSLNPCQKHKTSDLKQAENEINLLSRGQKSFLNSDFRLVFVCCHDPDT